jgi:hypothetical protein
MAAAFQTFQKFNDIGLANEIAERLKQSNIDCEIENYRIFEPSFANNTVEPDICLLLRPEDFVKAHQALDDYYKTQLDGVEKDYYLFDFTDQELLEILIKPDEWGHFDYQLAKKILGERGKEMTAEVLDLLKQQRKVDLSRKETAHKYLIWFGYFIALLGGFFGVIIGLTLTYYKKTLPDGETIYAYGESERNHGMRILIISAISLVFWLVIRLYQLDH